MSLPGEKDVTSIQTRLNVVVSEEFTLLQWLSFAFGFPCNLSTKAQICYARKTKKHDIAFIKTIELFPLPVSFSFLKYLL